MSSTVKTNSGDTWDAIAWKVWGKYADQQHMTDLINANKEHISTAIFAGAVTLIVPDVEETTAISIPPWRE